MKSYRVDVVRDGRWWMIRLPELDGVTQTRRLTDVESEARTFVAVTEDVRPSEVHVEITGVQVGDQTLDLAQAVERIARLREQAKEAERAATSAMRELAQKLQRDKVAMRDIGAVLGVSHQRVSQLLNAASVGSRH